MKALLFYVFVAIAAAAMILLSMGQALTPAGPVAQTGAPLQGGLNFNARALSHYAPSKAHYVYVNQEWLGRPTGLQIATKKTWRAPRTDALGVQLRLTPEIGARLAGKPIRVSVGVLPLKGGTTARELAVSAQDGGPVRWVRRPLTTESGKLEFELPATAGPVQAIGFWPYSETEKWWFDFGVEITSVDISTR